MTKYLFFSFVLLLFGCGSKKTSSDNKDISDSVKPKPFHIQLIVVGSTDSLHWKEVQKEFRKQFPEVKLSINPTIISVNDEDYLVKGKLDAAKQLEKMVKLKPDSVNSLMAITSINIAVKERILSNGKKYKNWSVLGLGSLSRGVCLVSYKRCKTMMHFTQTAVHEFGHTLGIKHCPDSNCIMVDADGDGSRLLKTTSFCEKCRKQVNTVLNKN